MDSDKLSNDDGPQQQTQLQDLVNKSQQRSESLKKEIKRRKGQLAQLKKQTQQTADHNIQTADLLAGLETEKMKLQVKQREGTEKLSQLDQTTRALRQESDVMAARDREAADRHNKLVAAVSGKIDSLMGKVMALNDEHKYKVLKSKVASLQDSVDGMRRQKMDQTRQIEKMRVDLQSLQENSENVCPDEAVMKAFEAAFHCLDSSLAKLEGLKQKDVEMNLQLQIRLQDKNRKSY